MHHCTHPEVAKRTFSITCTPPLPSPHTFRLPAALLGSELAASGEHLRLRHLAFLGVRSIQLLLSGAAANHPDILVALAATALPALPALALHCGLPAVGFCPLKKRAWLRAPLSLAPGLRARVNVGESSRIVDDLMRGVSAAASTTTTGR